MARWDASPGQRNPCVQLHMAEHDLAVLHAALARTRAPASLGRQVSRGARPVSPAVSHRDTEPPADLPPGVVPFQPRHPSPASTKGKAEAGDGITTLVRPGPGLAGQRAATLPRALVLTLPTEAARRVLEHLRTAADMLADERAMYGVVATLFDDDEIRRAIRRLQLGENYARALFTLLSEQAKIPIPTRPHDRPAFVTSDLIRQSS